MKRTDFRPNNRTSSISNYDRELIKGYKQESVEHPQLTNKEALQVARDHLKENPNYYSEQSTVNSNSISYDNAKSYYVQKQDGEYVPSHEVMDYEGNTGKVRVRRDAIGSVLLFDNKKRLVARYNPKY